MSNSPDRATLLGKIASYTEILAKDRHSTVFVPLSEAYRQLGMLTEAIEVVQQGIEAMPNFAPGFTAAGRILTQQKKFAEAAGQFERSLAIDGQSVTALKGLAKVRLLQQSPEEALPLLEKLEQLKPGDPMVEKMLASSRGKSGDAPKAETPARAKSGKSDDPISTATIAEIYIRQGFPRRALKVYHDLLVADPGNQELRQKFKALKRELESAAGNADRSAENTEASLAASPAEDSQPAPVAVAAPAEDSPTLAAAAEQSSSKEDRHVPDVADSYESKLNCWLDAIGRRRKNVR